jgi:succinate dehydrogenase/fumarate reductase-like Fe-S protein
MWPPQNRRAAGNELSAPNAPSAGDAILENLHELRKKMKKQCAHDEKCLEQRCGGQRKRRSGPLPIVRDKRAF